MMAAEQGSSDFHAPGSVCSPDSDRSFTPVQHGRFVLGLKAVHGAPTLEARSEGGEAGRYK